MLSVLLVLLVVGSLPLLGVAAEQTLAGALVSLTAVLGLVIFIGNTGVLSLGHVAFMAVGAYVTGLLTMTPAIKEVALPDLPPALASVNLHPVAAALVGAGVVAVLAVGTGVLISRVSGGLDLDTTDATRVTGTAQFLIGHASELARVQHKCRGGKAGRYVLGGQHTQPRNGRE